MATISPTIEDHPLLDDLVLPPLPVGKLSFEEFLDWCRGFENARVEWVDGEVIVMSPEKLNHGDLHDSLGAVFKHFVQHHRLGRVFSSEIMCRFRTKDREVGRVPDVLFVASDRLNMLKPTYIEGAPDLVVEIVSPDSSSRDYREKYLDYEAGGVREYWIVNPMSQRVEAWSRNAETGEFVTVVGVDGKLNSIVLPGFFLRPEWLRRDPLPDLSELLRALGI